MKTIGLIAALLLASAGALNAQSHYQDSKNPEILRHNERRERFRKEIIMPQVNGYNVYKADLHTHTIHSDADVIPSFRVYEAWYDGLDIIAITDHIEYRSFEEKLVKYLDKYVSDEYKGAVNHRIDDRPLKEGEVMVDLNYVTREAAKYAGRCGILSIPGAEITRPGDKIGHFNALFTADNNLIYDQDPVQAVRNAKAQGALVMHNHPGWKRTSIDYTPTELVLYEQGLIDGIEVMNTDDFYPGIIDRALEKKIFMSANTDIHQTTSLEHYGFDRPMTLILAKEKTLESVREALEARRTIAYGYNTLCGEQQLLKDFFVAGVRTAIMQRTSSSVSVALTNMTSIPYTIRMEGGNPMKLDPFTTLWLKVPAAAAAIELEVLNMFYSRDSHPVVQLAF